MSRDRNDRKDGVIVLPVAVAIMLIGGGDRSSMPPPFDAALSSPYGEIDRGLSSMAIPALAQDGSPVHLVTPPSAALADDQSDILVTGRRGHVAIDPLQAVNVVSYKATQMVDTAFTRPVAMAYERRIPGPVRDGLRNFFLNLHEVSVTLNFLAQMKPGKAAETIGRFAINTTIGLAGLFDMAKKKPFRLPRRRNSLADTLGYYGVGPGPFFFLPLIGPTTLRDVIGNGIDGLVLPTLVGKPFTGASYTLPSTVVRALDHRARADDRLAKLHADPDPYVATRADYLQRRQAEIDHLRGRDRVRAQ